MEGSTADAEFFRSLASVAPAILQRPQNQRGFGIVQIPFAASGWSFKGCQNARGSKRVRKVFWGDFGAGCHDDPVFDGGAEFADIAGPIVVEDMLHGLRGEFSMGLGVFQCAVLEEGLDQNRNVHFAIAEWRHCDRHDMQAEKQVVTEFSFGNEFGKILVRCSDQADIGVERFAASDTLEGSLAQDAQDFHLRGEVDLADLIQKQRAAFGLLKPADPTLEGSREGSFLMAEQLAREQLGRECGTMDGEEFPLRPGAEVVNGVCGEFFARAALALDQNRRAGGSHLLDRLENLHHCGGAADHSLEGVLALDLGAEFLVFLRGFALPDRSFDQNFQPVDIHRLGYKIVNTALHRLHSGIHRAIGRHHDGNRGIWPAGKFLDEFHSVAGSESQVGENHICADAFECFQCPIDIRSHIDLEFLLQRIAQPVSGVFFIINNQQRG